MKKKINIHLPIIAAIVIITVLTLALIEVFRNLPLIIYSLNH